MRLHPTLLCRMRVSARAVAGVSLGLLCLSLRLSAADIYPATYYSAATKTVAHYGYDIKQPGRENLTASEATELFVTQGFTVLRVPIYAMAHSNATTISDFTLYSKIATSITRAKAADASVKIFANLKLEGDQTYPSWLNTTGGKVNPTEYAKVIKTALAYYKTQTGYDADFIGPLCEQEWTEYAFTQGEFATIVTYLRANVPNCGDIIGPDYYNVAPSLTMLNALKSNGNFSKLDYVGTHYKNPNLTALKNFVAAADTKPVWNTESQGWDQLETGSNIADIEVCLAEAVECFDSGVRGFVWWAYSWTPGDVKGEVKSNLVRTTLGAHSVKITGSDPTPANMNDRGKMYFRAYRKGTRLSLWIMNRKADYVTTPLTFVVKDGETISGLVAQRRWNNDSVTTSGFATRSGNTITVTMPRYTCALVEFDIN